MTKWDYLTVRIRYEDKKHKDWVLEVAERAPLVGMQEILQKHGSDGWELVSLNPEDQEAYPGFGKYGIQTTVYRATFKRSSEY